MAPTFLKDLRRRSRASFRTNTSTDTSSDGAHSLGTAPSSGSLTPPSIAHRSDPALHTQVKESNRRTSVLPSPSLNASRHSVSGMTGLGSPSINGKQLPPLSKYAPRIFNISENAWVYQKTILLYGKIGEALSTPIDGTISVSRFDEIFPSTSWPVCESHFKILIHLQPGPNKIRFEFSSPKLGNTPSSNPIHASYLTIHMVPASNAPPLQLAILLAKDSPGTFDATPTRTEREGNGLDVAIRKFRMAAYLWQAFTAEQMWRNKLGRRSFRFEEEWTQGTASLKDRENGIMRSEARVHIIRCDKTMAELRDLSMAQQFPDATNRDGLYNIAAEAVKNYFNPLPGQQSYVSLLLLDSQWDPEMGIVRGHAAIGGSSGDLHLGVFGSHCLHSYPSSFEEVVPAFTDCTPTDTRYVANDDNEAGSSWEAANIGIGAHLREVGRLLGCPSEAEGIMLRDFVVINRTFVPREAFSTRTKSKGGLALQGDECSWHRLDCLRFRAHPAFHLPCDPHISTDYSVQAFAAENGNIIAIAAAGISFVEIYGQEDEFCHAWVEFPPEGATAQRQIILTDQDLRLRLPEDKRKGQVDICIKSHAGGSLFITDISEFTSKQATIKLERGNRAFRSAKVGLSQLGESRPQDVIFKSSQMQERILSRIVVYSEVVVFGLEFVYDDDSTQLFGTRGPETNGDIFEFDVRRGESLGGFMVRAGHFIDGIQITTTLGRKSPMFGNTFGGKLYTFVPPRGFNICGVAGSCGSWLDGFALLVMR